jgi:glycosyltransferase involved in cell wall biosynthesis
MFSNRGIAQEIPRALNELGYVVDIVNFDNTSWRPVRPYDLFIGHGGVNFEQISRALPDSMCRIYFSTGIYWRELNIREARRLYELALRRGQLLPPDRFARYSEEFANQVADGIICLGNSGAAATYAQFRNVKSINNAAFPVTWEGWRTKDYAAGRTHFLFYSGRGNVHKGLDRLLEAFIDSDLHLHICQHMEPDFVRAFHQELTQHPNIHVHGFVKMRSQEFEHLASRCGWVILPTCAEGQPGSVLECMAHGLIPILPTEANIDLEHWGIELPDSEISTIRAIAASASSMPPEELARRVEWMLDSVHAKYSVENFRTGFREAVAAIVSEAAVASP